MVLYFFKVLSLELLSILLILVLLFSPLILALRWKVALSVSVLCLYFLVSKGDAHFGKKYVQSLCDKSGMFSVKSTVQISDEYWIEPASDVFRDDEYRIAGVSYKNLAESQKIESFFEIYRFKHSLIDTSSREVLAYSVSYFLYRTWFERLIGANFQRKFSCGGFPLDLESKEQTRSFPRYMNQREKRVFVPENKENMK